LKLFCGFGVSFLVDVGVLIRAFVGVLEVVFGEAFGVLVDGVGVFGVLSGDFVIEDLIGEEGDSAVVFDGDFEGVFVGVGVLIGDAALLEGFDGEVEVSKVDFGVLSGDFAIEDLIGEEGDSTAVFDGDFEGVFVGDGVLIGVLFDIFDDDDFVLEEAFLDEVFFDSFEILDGFYFQFICSIFITNNNSALVHLNSRHCPHVVYPFLNAFVQSIRFSKTSDDN